MEKTFGIFGGDRRHAELLRLLRRDGYAAFAYGVEPIDRTSETIISGADTSGDADKLEPTGGAERVSDTWTDSGADTSETLRQAFGADVLFLPMPPLDPSGRFNVAGLHFSASELLDRPRPAQLLLSGRVPPELSSAARQRGLSLTDYMTLEPVAIANAAVTADAAISLTVRQTCDTLCGKRCLVLGFGRIGKALCNRLRGLGASVTAAARNPSDRAWIRALGYDAIHTRRLAGRLDAFSVVYNTIPAPILDAPLLRELPPDCFLMDLASASGVDFQAARELGLTAVWERGLPGRVAPRKAAAILRDAAYQLLKERK